MKDQAGIFKRVAELAHDEVAQRRKAKKAEKVMTTENAVIDLIIHRGEVGRKKYAETMDRADLSPDEWIQHYQEELCDALQYAERIKGAGKLLADARKMMDRLAGERGWEIAAEWCAKYDQQFGKSKK